MNVKTLVAAIALTLAAAPGLVAAATQGGQQKMSRIEVRADMAPDGHLSRGEAYGTVIAASSASRAEVLAELQAARADGRVVAGSESHGFFRSSDFISTRSRADVLAGMPRGLGRGDHLYGGS